MPRNFLLLLLIVFLFAGNGQQWCLALSWWPFGDTNSNDENNNQNYKNADKDVQSLTVPFEAKTAEDKFLQEAQKFGLQFSEQNMCHHKIILQLKKNCGSMTEEDVGKLSVQLLNCQSMVEGRRIYTCTMDMNLQDCTKDMDPNTWNAYHIVSNRARSVCYATRQQQFAAKTEITVNKLMWATQNQIESMDKLQEAQDKMSKLTGETLDTMSAGQKDLMLQQDKLRTAQSHIQAYVAGNLRELTREKALISAGQKELAGMTEAIRRKLDSANLELEKQEKDRRQNHKEIMQDLASLQKEAQRVWEKMDNNTRKVLLHHDETIARYQETLENLQRINETVSYLLTLINETRSEVDRKIGWLADLIGGTGVQLSVMYSAFLHAVFLMTAAIVAAFLQLPNVVRVTMVFLVPLNAITCANEAACLDFPSLTMVFVFITLAHWFMCIVRRNTHYFHGLRYFASHKYCLTFPTTNKAPPPPSLPQVRPLTQSTSRSTLTETHHSVLDSESDEGTINDNNSTRDDTSTVDRTEMLSRYFSYSSRQSLSPRRRSVSRGSTPSRKSCSGRNKQGTKCKLGCAEGQDYCHIHLHKLKYDYDNNNEEEED